MPQNPTKPRKILADNIASSIKSSSQDPKILLLEAQKQNPEISPDWESRYQHANQSDLENPLGIFFIIYGSPHPSKKGYSWA